MNLEKFTTDLIKIEFIEAVKAFGHFPFQLVAQDKDGKLALNALALGDVRECYSRFKYYQVNNYPVIFMSIDFPAGGDIEHDFVCVFSYQDNAYNAFAIPYNSENGEPYPVIKESDHLQKLFKEFTNGMVLLPAK